jgi:hypothetical protein
MGALAIQTWSKPAIRCEGKPIHLKYTFPYDFGIHRQDPHRLLLNLLHLPTYHHLHHPQNPLSMSTNSRLGLWLASAPVSL